MDKLQAHTKHQMVDKVGGLAKSPENEVNNYIDSKLQTQYDIEPSNVGTLKHTCEFTYLKTLREYRSSLKLQKQMLAKNQQQELTNASRTYKLIKIMSSLRQQFKKSNGFVKECVEKRLLADNKIKEEEEKHLALTKQIDIRQKELAEFKLFTNKLKITINKYAPYEEVLQQAVENSQSNDVNDLMTRCDAIMMAQIQILTSVKENIQQIETLRHNMLALIKFVGLKILGLKNTLANLTRSYNEALLTLTKHQKKLNVMRVIVNNNKVNSHRTREGIKGLYKLLYLHRFRHAAPVKKLKNRQIEDMLNFIMEEYDIIKATYNEIVNLEENVELLDTTNKTEV